VCACRTRGRRRHEILFGSKRVKRRGQRANPWLGSS
jgi:hypothetical protein